MRGPLDLDGLAVASGPAGAEAPSVERLHALPGVREAAILATCHRTELYIVATSAPDVGQRFPVRRSVSEGGSLSGGADPAVVYPPELLADMGPAGHSSLNELPAIVPVGTTMVPERHQLPGRADRLYESLSQWLETARPAQVTITRYESLDPIGHYFLRYAMPQEFGNVSEDDRRQYGQILESHYVFIDAAIGRALAALGPDDLLLVVSGYGMEPLGFGKRALEQLLGDPDVSGTHEGAPDGFLMAYGATVAKPRQPRRASIVDVVPTVLYFLGLPIGRDMDGYARTDIFQPSFTEEHPITFIPTYER